jgi:thioredoxin reductase (NADPH)
MEFPVSALDPTDPYSRKAQIFPRLSDEMSARVAAYGSEEDVAAGTLLFERGQRRVDFFLVLEGGVAILAVGDEGRSEVITLHGANEFTGDVDHFTDRQILVSARAATDSRLVRIRLADFRRMIAAESDIGEIMMRAFILRRVGLIRHAQGGVVLIGPRRDADTLRIQRFLTRNAYPHRLLDTEEDPDAEGFVECFSLKADRLPVVISGDQVLNNPSTALLAGELGLIEEIAPDHVHDLIVVGAGPAGLAAAVYGASEGLDTLMIEAIAPGGQAGTSSKIENYLGFPTGISGAALAGRAQVQAQKFGARIAVARAATALDCETQPYRVRLDDGSCVMGRAVVIATGARYRTLSVPGYERFEGQGIHYAATAMESQLCSGEPAVVVGGGNSAGQAAVYLAQSASHVHVLVRSGGLAATMSDYLIRRIEASDRITLHAQCEITALAGDSGLREVEWKNRATGDATRVPARNVFVMIGAAPNTAWLKDCLSLDASGFVKTGHDEEGSALDSPFATSRLGVFAVGDVRSGSVKRVASGVGEGSVVVQAVHRYLNPGA